MIASKSTVWPILRSPLCPDEDELRVLHLSGTRSAFESSELCRSTMVSYAAYDYGGMSRHHRLCCSRSDRKCSTQCW